MELDVVYLHVIYSDLMLLLVKTCRAHGAVSSCKYIVHVFESLLLTAKRLHRLPICCDTRITQ